MKKRQSFLGGASILMFSTLLVKTIGAFYKIPLTNLLGGVGMGYYMSAYGLFNPIYSMSVAGFPIAVSKFISSKTGSMRTYNSISVLRSAFLWFSTIGIVMWFLLYALATPFAHMVNNPDAALAIRAIAPAILFAAAGAAFRGYYEGHHNMFPTGFSQGIEAVCKLIFGTVLAVMAMKAVEGKGAVVVQHFWQTMGVVVGDVGKSMPVVAAAGIFGVTVGSMSSLLFLGLYSLTTKEEVEGHRNGSHFSIGKELLSLAIPVSMAALMTNIASVVDLISVMSGLATAVEHGEELLRSVYHGAIPMAIPSSDLPSFLYGTYTGLAMTIFNIVPALTLALGTALLPMVSTLWASKRHRELRQTVTLLIKLVGMLTIPAGIGIVVMAKPILLFFFRNNPAEVAVAVELLRILGIAVIFSGFVSPLSCILQGIGQVYLPAKLMAVGGTVKLLLNLLLVHFPQINIRIAPFSTLTCYGIITLATLTILNHHLDLNLNLVGMFLKPLFGSFLCAFTAKYVHGYLLSFFGNRVSLLLGILLGGMVYLLTLLLTGAITAQELRLLKGSEKWILKLQEKGILS